MKKIIIMILMLSVIATFANALRYDVSASTATRIYIPCYNATSGVRQGTTADLTLWDSAGNKDVNAAAATNAEAGTFYYSINLGADLYSGYLNCTGDSVDTPVVVYSTTKEMGLNTTLLASVTAIEADTSAMDTAAELRALLTNTPISLNSTDSASLAGLVTDSDAQDTAAEWRTLMTNAPVSLNASDDASLLAIETDTAAFDTASEFDTLGATLRAKIELAVQNNNTKTTSQLTGVSTDVNLTKAAVVGNFTAATFRTLVTNAPVSLNSSESANLAGLVTDSDAQDTALEWRTLGNNLMCGLNSTDNTIITAIQTDSDAQDAASEWNTLMATAITTIDSTLNISHSRGNWSDIGAASSLTAAQIDTQLNNSHGSTQWTTATGFSTAADVTTARSVVESAVLSNKTATITQITTSQGVVEGAVLSNQTKTSGYVDTEIPQLDSKVTQVSTDVNTTKGYVDTEITTIDDYVDTEIAELIGMARGNATYWNVWGAVTRTLTTADWTTDSDITTSEASIVASVLGNSTRIVNVGNANWTTATGFATQANVDTECLDGTELTTATVGVCTSVTNNVTVSTVYDKTLYGLTVSTENDIDDILADTNAQDSNAEWKTLGAGTSVNVNGSVSTTVNTTAIWNEIVSCTANPSTSAGCILWSVERYTR